MKNESLLMIKPSTFPVDVVYEYIINELSNNGLVVKKEYEIMLSEEQICQIWPWLQTDIILFYTHKEMYNKPVKVLEVFGKSAIEIVDNIKKDVRKRFANSLFLNFIHAPRNEEEYKSDFSILYKNIPKNSVCFSNMDFRSFTLLKEDICKDLAHTILNVNLYTMMPYISYYSKNKKKYNCYIVNGCAQRFTYYVCFICDYFEYYSMKDAVILMCILLANGEVCVHTSDDENYVCNLKNEAEAREIEMEIHSII